jgi:hypothetical protein
MTREVAANETDERVAPGQGAVEIEEGNTGRARD